MKLYFFIKVQHTGDTDLGQAELSKCDFSSTINTGGKQGEKVNFSCSLNNTHPDKWVNRRTLLTKIGVHNI